MPQSVHPLSAPNLKSSKESSPEGRKLFSKQSNPWRTTPTTAVKPSANAGLEAGTFLLALPPAVPPPLSSALWKKPIPGELGPCCSPLILEASLRLIVRALCVLPSPRDRKSLPFRHF